MRKPRISTSKVKEAKADSEWMPLVLALAQLLGAIILFLLVIAGAIALIVGGWWLYGFIIVWVIQTVAYLFNESLNLNPTFLGYVAVGLLASIVSGFFTSKVTKS